MIGSLSDLVMMAGMPSEPKLRKLINDHPDFPIISRGKNGVSYEFDLAAASAFVRDVRQREEQQARARSDEVRQFGLELLGEDAAATQASVGLSPSERKALLEEELIAIKVAERRGELIRKSGVEAAIIAVLSLVEQQRRSFAARLSKRTELSREQIALIDKMLESDGHALADKFEELGNEATDAASTASENPQL